MKYRVFYLLLVVLLFTADSAAQLSGKNRWLNVRSKNFNIVGEANEKELRQVTTKLEQFREAFRLIFRNMNHQSSVETNVLVFRNADSFRPFRPKRPDGKSDEWIAGYFLAGEDRNFITLSAEYSKEDTYSIIFHEYIHYLMDANIGRGKLPAWLNEGIAEFYQTFKITDDQVVRLGEPQFDHIAMLRSTQLMPMDEFVQVTNSSLHRGGGRARNTFYAQSWLLMHFLMLGENGAYSRSLNEFINLRNREVPESEAFRQAFKMEPSAFDELLRKYLAQPTMPVTGFDLGKKLTFDSERQVSPVSEAAANSYLGDLLYRMRDYSEAEKYLARAIDLEPASASAKTSLGLVRMRQRRFDEAKKLLESAAAGADAGYFTLYNYAYVLSRESMDEFGYVRSFPEADILKMQSSLRNAIKLRPEFTPSLRLLVFVNLVSGRDLDEALTLIQQAIRQQPGDQQLALMAARLYLRRDDIPSAERIASRVSNNPSKPELKTQADQLLKTIEEIKKPKSGSWGEPKFTALGVRPVTVVDRNSISAEEAERLEKQRVLRNLNRLVGKPGAGEKQIVGNIAKIVCANGAVRYEIVSDGKPIVLSGKDFASLRMQILHEGTSNRLIGCGADLNNELVVISYLSQPEPRTNSAGTLTAISFVPAGFRLMSDEELNAVEPIVVGGPATNLEENEKKIKAEMEEMALRQREAEEERRRLAMADQIVAQLRQPLSGEVRGTGTLEMIECTAKTETAVVRINGQTLKLRMPAKREDLISKFFVYDVSRTIGCRTGLPDIKAIITYLPNAEIKGGIAGELKAIEFVPPSVSID